jgi:TonB family protein
MTPPPSLPPTLHPKAVWASRHPRERLFVGRSVALSVVIHLLFAVLVGLLAIWLDRITFSRSSSIAQSGPAPEQTMTVNLVMTQPRPPSPPKPTPTPPLGLPVLPPIPLPKPPVLTLIQPPPPNPIPQLVPTPVAPAVTETKTPTLAPHPVKIAAKSSNKPRPKYTAVHATGEGKTPDATSLQLATLGYPAPSYPSEARALHETGTVLMEVVFGSDGAVARAEIWKSSGFSILDMSTRSFIRGHWKDISRANTTVYVPIIYYLE